QLDEILNALQELPSFIPADRQLLLSNKLTRLARIVAEKAELLETFKSQNAVLNNSLRYFPLTSTALLQRAATNEAGLDLTVTLNELMRRVLVYHLNPS